MRILKVRRSESGKYRRRHLRNFRGSFQLRRGLRRALRRRALYVHRERVLVSARLHDLRHTFAVRALQGSPAGRSRCGAHMVALATYMGHVNIYATYWYLEATADLMRDVAAAGEEFLCEGGRS